MSPPRSRAVVLAVLLALLGPARPASASWAETEPPATSPPSNGPALEASAPALVEFPTGRSDVRLRASPAAAAIAGRLAERMSGDLVELEALLGRGLSSPVEVRIGQGRDEFVRLHPPGRRAPGWAAGVAWPHDGLVVIDAVASGRHGDVGAVLRHELAHIALGQLGDRDVPRWFTEGFALVVAGELTLDRTAVLARAAGAGALLELDDLDRGWPDAPGDVELAYAQSGSFVAHLIGRREGEAIRALFRELARGARFDEAFREAFAEPRAVLEVGWRRELRSRWGLFAFVLNAEAAWVAAALLVVLGALRVRAGARRRLAELEAEEREAEADAARAAEAERSVEVASNIEDELRSDVGSAPEQAPPARVTTGDEEQDRPTERAEPEGADGTAETSGSKPGRRPTLH